jgi:CRISPR/Cas system CSM-associated protein Csm4 (group 5 of RAMP superfamily)
MQNIKLLMSDDLPYYKKVYRIPKTQITAKAVRM